MNGALQGLEISDGMSSFEKEEENGIYKLWWMSDITWCVQVLRSPKEAFAAAKQSWRERCKKYVCLHGDYFEK